MRGIRWETGAASLARRHGLNIMVPFSGAGYSTLPIFR